MRPSSAPPRVILLTLLALGAGACGGHATYVKSDDSALGRVVVYRNGIAYYERRAHVADDTLTLSVPNDKVDDFLKSLTVIDAATRKTVPVSYPTRGASRGSTVDMTIQLPKAGPHDVILTYITEAPAWKPSYRLVVEDDKVNVQGWAIVDNTSGEDWRDVKVGVGSSSALSFRFDLRTVVNVHREELQGERRLAVAPPTGGATHGGADDGLVLAVRDEALPRPAGHPDVAQLEDMEVMVARRETRGRRGRGDRAKSKEVTADATTTAGPASGAAQEAKRSLAQMAKLADKLKHTKGTVVLEGYAGAGELDGDSRSLDRANVLRNHLIEQGIAPGRLQVVSRGNVAGKDAGVEIRLQAAQQQSTAAADTDNGEPVGESHFESDSPMTIVRGTSAMVSILDQSAQGDVVYLYAPEAERGSQRYAFKAVRLVNPTDSTLETGPVTVYGKGRFIGEGLTNAIPPGATAVIPFALDRQVVVEKKGSTADRIARLLTLQRGVFTAEVKHSRKTQMEITNRLGKPARVFVRHVVRDGWTLDAGPKVYERLGEAHLFEVVVAPGATTSVVIEESTPLQKTVDLRSSVGLDLVRVYLQTPPDDARYATALARLIAIHDEMANHLQGIQSLRERMTEYRVRMDELHTQVASLKQARVGGSLMRHLQKKMGDISERVQKSTIAVVDHQENLMMARIRFQDAVSELSLDTPSKAATKTPAPTT